MPCGMHLPASLKSCRTRPSPAIRSSLCRSTPQPRTTCRGFACSAFRRDRSKKNSKRCSSKANEETQQNCDRTARKKWCRPTSDTTGRSPSWVKSVVFTVVRSLPVFPHKRTFSGAVGMSHRCQTRKSPLHSIRGHSDPGLIASRSLRGTTLSEDEDETLVQQPACEIPGGTSLRSDSQLVEI